MSVLQRDWRTCTTSTAALSVRPCFAFVVYNKVTMFPDQNSGMIIRNNSCHTMMTFQIQTKVRNTSVEPWLAVRGIQRGGGNSRVNNVNIKGPVHNFPLGVFFLFLFIYLWKTNTKYIDIYIKDIFHCRSKPFRWIFASTFIVSDFPRDLGRKLSFPFSNQTIREVWL